MKFLINATILVHAEVEGDSEEEAWEHFRSQILRLPMRDAKVEDFTVEEVSQDEISQVDDDFDEDEGDDDSDSV